MISTSSSLGGGQGCPTGWQTPTLYVAVIVRFMGGLRISMLPQVYMRKNLH